MSSTEIARISTDLGQAKAEIKQRQQAKQTLDLVVKVVITAANIASKLAA